CIGLLLALKTSGVALVAILVARRRWTAIGVAAVTAIALAVAITPFIDPEMWLVYPSQVRAYVARPASSVTAYQTTLSLFRHLCVADAQWNPSPAARCAPIAFAGPTLIVGVAVVFTMWLARRSARPASWLSAAAALSVLALPAVAEPHFALLAIPLALLRLNPFEIAAVGLLLIVPLEWTAERFTSGWWALLAYPRLYAAWWLWAIAVGGLRTESRAPR
ncbi:MAG TPA: glycosyltransferase 87 family protein, partial [Vicinamibacterales bacterium]|nr:glycosyltransferase 87 family protein [Vicinamibacterales bacterium]